MAFEEITREALRKVADFLFTKSQDNIVDMGISDTGALLLSGEILPADKDGKTIILYTAPYASAIDTGSKPHKVDPEDLEDWVRRKLGEKGEKNIKRRAFFISRKIKKFGTKPQPFFTKAIEDTKIKFRI